MLEQHSGREQLRRCKPVFQLIIFFAVMAFLIFMVASCRKVPLDSAPTPTETTRLENPFPTVNNLIQTPLPYNPIPQPTLTPAKIIIQPSYSLPLWMGDPDTVILMDLIIGNTGEAAPFNLLFLNALTGEKYYIPIPSDAGKYFWFDNKNFGFLSNNLDYMYLINASDGFVTTIQVSESSTHFLTTQGYFQALEVEHNPARPDDYVFHYAHEEKNRQYSAFRDTSKNGFPISIMNRDNEIVWQSSSVDGLWESEFTWSPVDDRVIAIVRGIPDERDAYGMLIKSKMIQLIDVVTNQIISSYLGDFNEIVWSPNGENILYQHAISLDFSIGHGFRDAPCILALRTGESKCLASIPQEHIPDGYILQTTARYSWSPDGAHIRYVYFYHTPYTESGDIQGNLCIYSLMNGEIVCPTENIPKLKGKSILGYNFSPDEQFIYLCYSVNSLFSDDQTGSSYDGLINVNGSGFVSWAGQIFSEYPPDSKCSLFGPIWRPLP